MLGVTFTKVTYEGQEATLPLIVVEDEGPTLFGRNWLYKIMLNCGKIHYTPSSRLQDLLGMYRDHERV